MEAIHYFIFHAFLLIITFICGYKVGQKIEEDKHK